MRNLPFAALIAISALGAPHLLHAQSYQGRDAPVADEDSEESDSSTRRTEIEPYIEVAQIVTAQISPGSDVVTYTQVAAGVDAALQGRRSQATVSVRYERNFGWGNDTVDSDSIVGLARGSFAVVPHKLMIDAGALASRNRISAGGGNVFDPSGDSRTSQIYSGYIGPRYQDRFGDVEVTGSYRLGYTRVEAPDFVTGGGAAVDVFDESVSHNAQIRAGTQPGEPLPVGVGVGAGLFQEDINQLDQRVRDAYVRGDVTVPVTPTLAFVGGIGVEDVEVSSRDALRDAAGVPVIGPDGRFVTDPASPRRIAFDAEGLIWDVGVVWRPSRRTSLSATFGHRYDSETFYGNFAWQPDSRSSVGIGVYDGISGFGGRLNNALANLPTDFQVIRDPVTGDIVGCVNALAANGCLDGLLGSIRSSVFRSRGVAANYSRRVGRMTASLGAGYDRRNFIGAPGTVLASANGIVDESYYVVGSLGGALGSRAGYSVTTYANWFDSGSALGGDAFSAGGSAAYRRELTRHLSARAAVALNYLDSELSAEDFTSLSALVGLRYGF